MRNIIRLFVCASFLFFSSNFPFSEQQKATLKNIVRSVDPNINIGIYVISPNDVQHVYAKNIHKLFTPASNAKLFVAAAALHIFGPAFCFKTSLVTDGYCQGDALHGNLYLKASGDPSFTRKNLEDLFSQLKAAGIIDIEGDVCIDFSLFDDDPAEYFAKGYCMDDLGEIWDSPTTSFIIDSNTTTFSWGKTIALDDPHQYALFVVRDMLEKHAITCHGTVRISSTPNKTMQELAQHNSELLKELVAHMLKTSDNLYANALFKKLGAHESGTPGTWENGKRAVKNFLKTYVGINPDKLVLEDGAGLSRYNLISPHQIVQLLKWIYDQPEFFDIFVECLPISATDGTLAKRITHYPGVVRAKTGTMGGISSLSGYLCIEGHEPLIFSILMNDFIEPGSKSHIHYKTDIEDELCAYLIECVC